MINVYGLLMILNAFIAAISQLLLKTSANKTHSTKIREFLNVYVITGYLLLFITLILNIVAYNGLDFKYGPVLSSTSYAFVLILGAFVLKEKLTSKKSFGMFLIMLGVIIFGI